MEEARGVKKDFWWMLGLFLAFIAFAVASMFWGGYPVVGYGFAIAGAIGVAILAYIFRPDAASRN